MKNENKDEGLRGNVSLLVIHKFVFNPAGADEGLRENGFLFVLYRISLYLIRPEQQRINKCRKQKSQNKNVS
jgi:hypothetical protein